MFFISSALEMDSGDVVPAAGEAAARTSVVAEAGGELEAAGGSTRAVFVAAPFPPG